MGRVFFRHPFLDLETKLYRPTLTSSKLRDDLTDLKQILKNKNSQIQQTEKELELKISQLAQPNSPKKSEKHDSDRLIQNTIALKAVKVKVDALQQFMKDKLQNYSKQLELAITKAKSKTSKPLSTEIKTSEPLSTEIKTSEPPKIKTSALLSTEIKTSEPLSTEIKTSEPLSTEIKTSEPPKIKTSAPLSINEILKENAELTQKCLSQEQQLKQAKELENLLVAELKRLSSSKK